jgi:group I intron endonuclease
MKNYTTGIYKITNRCNGKTYIGQSVRIERRWIQHKAPCTRKRKTYLQNAFEKYGIENFDFEILQECTKEELNELEIKWIIELKSQGKAEYNISAGGFNNPFQFKTEEELEVIHEKMRAVKIGRKLTEEHKRKIGEAGKGRKHSPEAKEKIRHAALNRSPETREKYRQAAKRNMTEEAKERLREINTGKKLSPETIEKIKMSNSNPSEETRKKISQSLNNMTGEAKKIRSEKISVANTGRKHTEEARQKISKAQYKKVVCVETGFVYESTKAVGEIFGKSSNRISVCLRDSTKCCLGFHWRRFDKILDKDKPVISVVETGGLI